MNEDNPSNNCTTGKQFYHLKKLLEDSILIPYSHVGFINGSRELAFLPRFLFFKLSEKKIYSFVMNLSYGKHSWSIKKNIFSLFSLCLFLLKKGIRIKKYEDISDCLALDVEAIEEIIEEIIETLRFHEYLETLMFFQLSYYSFFGKKMYEDKFYVQVGKYSDNNCFFLCCNCNVSIIKKMYVICKNTHLIFYDYENTKKIFSIIFFTKSMGIKYYQNSLFPRIGIHEEDNVNYLINSRKKRRIEELNEHIKTSLLPFNNFYEPTSSFPLRYNNIVNFHVDGKKYFDSLYESLILSKNEIFISGWWVHPKIYLKRIKKGRRFDKNYRLDVLLKKKASEGIKIYILIYQESRFALSINSNYTYSVFKDLHSNIKINKSSNSFADNYSYWSHHEKLVVIDQKYVFLGGVDLCLGRYDTNDHLLFDKRPRKNVVKSALEKSKDSAEGCEEHYWPGMDFSNPLKSDFKSVENPKINLIDRENVPRMPWHDVQCKLIGDSAFDLSLDFIKKWNYLVDELGNDQTKEYIVPNESFFKNYNSEDLSYPYVKCQVLKSSGNWFCHSSCEDSIYKCYKRVIQDSKNYIYIENQFFITKSSVAEDTCFVNEIGMEIVKRIEEAHKRREQFKVYIIIPLLPAFEMNDSLKDNYTMHKLIDLQMKSISKERWSLIEVLKEKEINYKDYIVFLSLQKYEYKKKELYQEQIYVHSKICVVDGTKMIIGSANINDRSMLGNRDTELCIYIEDERHGQIGDLVRELLQEHMGLINSETLFKQMSLKKNRMSGIKKHKVFIEKFLENDIIDLSDVDFFKTIQYIANKNSRIYRKVFKTFPNDKITNYVKLEKNKSKEKISTENCKKIKKYIKQIVGRFVMYPKKFLIEEEIKSDFISIQNMLPDVVYF